MCEVCNQPIEGRKKSAKTCSAECSHERRLRRARAYASARYAKADPRPSAECEACGAEYAQYRSSSRFCSRRCQWNAHQRLRSQSKPQAKCWRCGISVERRPGRAVCQDCRHDGRDRSGYNKKRRLASYGLNDESFADLLALQGGGCAICGTKDPGYRGWQIDHDHGCCSGFGSCGKCVRGLLCVAHNLAIGQFGDNPELLRAAATYIESRRSVTT